MREISLSDNEIKNTVYDTSGSYSSQMKRSYESGLIKLRESWINSKS